MSQLQRFHDQARQLRQQEQQQPGSVQTSEVLKLLHFTLSHLLKKEKAGESEVHESTEVEEGRTGEEQGMFISVETYHQLMYTLRLLAPYSELAVGGFVRLLSEAEGKTIERATQEVREKGVFAHLYTPPAVDTESMEPVHIQEPVEAEDADVLEEEEVSPVEEFPLIEELTEPVETSSASEEEVE